MNEYNGPLYFIPGSHKLGPLPATLDTVTTSYPLWVANKENIAASIEEKGIVSATGTAGTLLIFGENIIINFISSMVKGSKIVREKS